MINIFEESSGTHKFKVEFRCPLDAFVKKRCKTFHSIKFSERTVTLIR